jgi:glutamine phosphoribosylpyrophosphate amidotransferase
MCGIVGFIKTKKHAKLDVEGIVKTMLACRNGGLDSSGIFLHEKRHDPFICHSTTPIEDLIDKHKDDIKDLVQRADIGLIHTRHATIGKVDLSNAQPFVKYPYIFLHNGHINGLGNDKISDSKELGAILMRYGVKALKPYIDRGWANIAIYNMETKRLIVSPDPTYNRVYVLYKKGYIVFASQPDWVKVKGQAHQLKTTMEYTVGKTPRRRIDNFRWHDVRCGNGRYRYFDRKKAR